MHGVPLLDWAHGGRMEGAWSAFRLQKEILICSQVQGPQNVILCFAPASQNGLKGKIRDLKQQFEEFWERKNLCRFFSDPKLFRLVLKSRIFPLNPFWLAGANHKITFWGPWTYLKINLHCKLRDLVALWEQKSKKNGYLRIQGRM